MADQQDTPIVKLNADVLDKLGKRLLAGFEQAKKDRRQLEEQWLKNIRQVRGIYDPEIKKYLDADRSQAYPKITRQKTQGTISRLMEMLFPQTEKNWGVQSSPVPDIDRGELQKILDALQAQAGTQPDPVTQQQVPADLPPEKIEEAVKKFSDDRARRMTTQMDDQLEDMDYVSLVREVIGSAVEISAGVLKGPLVTQEKKRIWKKDGATGQYTAIEVMTDKPYYEVVNVFDYYPDLSAKEIDQQEGEYQRHVMSRFQVRALANRKDFLKEPLIRWLRDHPRGNLVELWWETELRSTGTSDRANVSDLSGRKYELAEYWGFVTGEELAAAGVNIAESFLQDEYEANVWTIDNVVVKAVVNPYKRKRRPFHVFVYEKDMISLLGNGLPATLRDSQMAICESARMMLDNASAVCGPILEANEDLLKPGQDTKIHAYKVFVRESAPGMENQQAIREIRVDSHIPELENIIRFFMEIADTEAALPPPALGDPSKGGSEALRTSQGMSMLLGAASLPIRDTVRNFDKFTESVIGSLVDWNMQFNADQSIKGDFTILAKGSTSLIAKEVRAASLDAFKATLDPDDKVFINTKELLLERMRSRDLPMTILDSQENVQKKLDDQAALAAKQQQLSESEINSVVRKNLADAFKSIQVALKAQSDADVKTFETVMEGLSGIFNPESASGSNAGATGS